ncbi:NAD(+)--rifampin ADP-ribosyltransferase [Lactococcus petauri]|uniref:NAD(+)--rifampin ADP-ribosyltransferase n=1 Tax=Lactococcus petauri TaxID=1940789 RepID=A0A252CB65_9LACT|nr:NAD(+)--rifampin ADP-ribosyltransferase [Lactococcus petauri]OUK03821.1 NAD(+)--rifampin ADP-ribosyltransferase [Lactococcus petauri]
MEKVHDEGPFYHGTKAKLKIVDYLRAGFASNYDSRVTMNHIYFTALKDGAGFAAQIAAGKAEVAHVYLVEPTGPYENDPNVTDKKFPGNPTRSYRSTAPLKIIAEVTDWVEQPQDKIDSLREKIAARTTNNKSTIIN